MLQLDIKPEIAGGAGIPVGAQELINMVRAAPDQTFSVEQAGNLNTNPNSPPAPKLEAPPAAPILGKFKTQDDLVKAYQELERKLGATAKPAETLKPAETQKPVDGLKIDPAPAAPAAPTALISQEEQTQFSKEFLEAGALSDESYESLAKKGFPKAIVDTYIRGQMAMKAEYDNSGFEAAGGKEQFTQMAQWAAKSLNPAAITAFNNACASGDVATMQLAVAGLRSQYEAANGRAPNLLSGSTGGTGGPLPFRSLQQLSAAMADPRYQHDPAYRAEVAQRAAASTF